MTYNSVQSSNPESQPHQFSDSEEAEANPLIALTYGEDAVTVQARADHDRAQERLKEMQAELRKAKSDLRHEWTKNVRRDMEEERQDYIAGRYREFEISNRDLPAFVESLQAALGGRVNVKVVLTATSAVTLHEYLHACGAMAVDFHGEEIKKIARDLEDR